MWDQNKSFLSIRSAESNRRRTWCSAPVWYLGEAIASQEQNGILISGRIEFWFCVYFLFQILSVSCLEILCAWVINWVGLTFWGKNYGVISLLRTLPSQCWRLFLLEKESVRAETSESSFPFLSPECFSSEDPSLARSGGNGRGLLCESKAASQVPVCKGISGRGGKKEATSLHLINPSREVWR